jgi:two-component system invasion response regulator UvrY
MIRVCIVDDHPVVRRGLRQIIDEQKDMNVAGEAVNAQETFRMIRGTGCDVLVLDITLPGVSGLDVLEQLRHECPKLPVLILSVHPEDQYALRVLKAGAAGYMMKDSAPNSLVKAIRKIVSGGKYVSQTLAESLISGLEKKDALLHECLSNREHQVLCLLASGTTITQIAAGMNLSPKTISTYRARVLQKMDLKTNADMTAYAMRNRLIE